MNKEEKPRSESISKTKKPGPRPTACLWCNSTDCNHCRCTGQVGCGHKKGEMCPNPRYKRRLVCNSCEKNKLREKQQSNTSQAVKRKRARTVARAAQRRDNAKLSHTKEKTSGTTHQPSVKKEEEECSELLRYSVVAVTVSIYLQNTNSVILSFLLNNKLMTLSDIRPFITQQLKLNPVVSKFVYMDNNRPIPYELVRFLVACEFRNIPIAC